MLDTFGLNYVSEDQNQLLVSSSLEDEIHDAIFGLDASSSPGPNDFWGSILSLLLGGHCCGCHTGYYTHL